MSRGCSWAGVPAVVASLWRVDDDQTPFFMNPSAVPKHSACAQSPGSAAYNDRRGW
jgi:hypothetical protein